MSNVRQSARPAGMMAVGARNFKVVAFFFVPTVCPLSQLSLLSVLLSLLCVCVLLAASLTLIAYSQFWLLLAILHFYVSVFPSLIPLHVSPIIGFHA